MTRPDRPLTAADFPPDTATRRFFAWNEARGHHDRRYEALRAVSRLERHAAVAYLVGPEAVPQAILAAEAVLGALDAAAGAEETGRHAALFRALDRLEDHVDLAALPAHRLSRRRAGARRILVIKLSALGDFIQALGPMAAIRRHHAGDHITLLTTAPFAGFARSTGHFDAVEIDRRAPPFDLAGLLALRHLLRNGRFDRVYDLQTSQRSSFYARLWWPAPPPEWSGIAAGCSHPHAFLGRDPQHTIEKQAEQLLMAGIHPVPLPALPDAGGALPDELARVRQGRRFALLVPGSSPGHPGKRWPAERYGELARALAGRGLLPVVLGGTGERDLALTIAARAPETLDLTGRTGLPDLAALARAAAVTIGNDTGVSHIAAAGGGPLVVLFSGESEPSRCAPRGDHVTVLRSVPLADLALAPVLAAVDRALR